MFRKPYLALDIGNKNIKIVWGLFNKNKIEIIEYGIINTPANSIKDGKVINARVIADLIKDFMKKSKVSSNKMILNITGTGVITRDVLLPKSTDEEIEKILEFDAQQYFPVDLENYVLDYKVQEEVMNPEGVFNRILLVAVPINQADEYMKIPKLLKMEMEAIDLPANCLSKMLFGNNVLESEVKASIPENEFAVLDIGSETTGVYIFYENKLKFSRILLNGSLDIDKLISNEFNVDFKRAEEIKIIMSKVVNEEEEVHEDPETVQICNIIRPTINNQIIDINRFFEFYNSRSTGNKLQKIYLYGGGSKLEGLERYISGYFNIPVSFLHCLDHVVYKGKKKQEEFTEDFIYLINAIGAVVR